jgi:hypothetical protein
VAIINSTLTGNRTNSVAAGLAGGSGIIVNTTIANNDGGFSGDALFATQRTGRLQRDCFPVRSFNLARRRAGPGHLPAGNTCSPQAMLRRRIATSNDLTGRPAPPRETFVDDGTPGQWGVVPLFLLLSQSGR